MKIQSLISALVVTSFVSSAALAEGTFNLPATLAPTVHHLNATMTLAPNASDNCQKALGNVKVNGQFAYQANLTTLMQVAQARIDNLSPGVAPVYATLDAQGLDGIMAFGKYYKPSMPISSRHGMLGLKGVILNGCSDHTMQAAVMIELPATKDVCLMTTPIWNQCQ